MRVQSSLRCASASFANSRSSAVVQLHSGYKHLYSTFVSTEFGKRDALLQSYSLGMAHSRMNHVARREFCTETEFIDVERFADRGAGAEDLDVHASLMAAVYRSQIREVLRISQFNTQHRFLFRDVGFHEPRIIHLTGPNGIGKRLIVELLQRRRGGEFVRLQLDHHDPDLGIADAMERARRSRGTVLYLYVVEEGDLDHVDVRRRFKRILGEHKAHNYPFLFVLVSEESALSPEIMAEVDRTIELGAPDTLGRVRVLKQLTSRMKLDDTVDLTQLARRTSGFLARDLSRICRRALELRIDECSEHEVNSLNERAAEATIAAKEAAVKAAATAVAAGLIPNHPPVSPDSILVRPTDLLVLSSEHFERALDSYSPLSPREVHVESPEQSFSDLAGLESIKSRLTEWIVWPRLYAQLFHTYRIDPPRVILLAGPSGCGKRALVSAAARQAQSKLLCVKGHEVLSRWHGYSVRLIRELFAKARAADPCVLLIEDLDQMVPRQDTSHGSHESHDVLHILLSEMEGTATQKRVLIVATTSRPDLIDPAVASPAVIDELLIVPPPDRLARMAMIEVTLRGLPLNEDAHPDNSQFMSYLGDRTENFTGSDVRQLCHRAKMLALREDIQMIGLSFDHRWSISREHFEQALQQMAKAMETLNMSRYEDFQTSFRSMLH